VVARRRAPPANTNDRRDRGWPRGVRLRARAGGRVDAKTGQIARRRTMEMQAERTRMARIKTRIMMAAVAVLAAGLAAAGVAVWRLARNADARFDELVVKLEAIDQRMERIESAAGRGRGAAGQPRRPDPAVIYAVPVGADDPQRGARHAKVTIVEAYEHACPHCATLAPVMDEVVKKYGDQARVVSKPFVIHPPTATLPALAVCAANKQGKYEAFERALWARAWKSEDGRPRMDASQLAREALEATATSVGLDLAKFRADLNGAACKEALERDRRALSAVGTAGTPAVYINGRFYTGPRTLEAFGAVIEEEIRKADAAIAKGVPLEEYYASLMKGARPSL
jgi:protein-disulfide isomerase